MLKHPATGYSEKLHDCYKEVQKITGDRVFIIFEDEGEWYGNYLDELEKNIYKRNWYFDNKEHIAFRYPEAFIKIFTK